MGVVAHVLFVSLDTFAECSRVLELNQRPPELRKPMALVRVLSFAEIVGLVFVFFFF